MKRTTYSRVRQSRLSGTVVAECDHCAELCAYWEPEDTDERTGLPWHDCPAQYDPKVGKVRERQIQAGMKALDDWIAEDARGYIKASEREKVTRILAAALAVRFDSAEVECPRCAEDVEALCECHITCPVCCARERLS